MEEHRAGRKLCDGRAQGRKGSTETKILDDEFSGCVFHISIFFFFLLGWFTTLAKDSRHAWSLLGANWLKPHTI